MKYRNFKNRVTSARWLFNGLHLVCGHVSGKCRVLGVGKARWAGGRQSMWGQATSPSDTARWVCDTTMRSWYHYHIAMMLSWRASGGWLRERVKDREAWRAAAHGLTKCQKGLSNWTTSICNIKYMAHSKSNIVLTKTHSCGESPYCPASGCSIMHNWGKWPCKGCCRGLWAHERGLAFQSQHHWKSAV